MNRKNEVIPMYSVIYIICASLVCAGAIAPSESPLFTETSSTKDSIYLQWAPPSDNSLNGKLLGYKITYSEPQWKKPQTIEINDSSITNFELNNLMPYTAYKINVQAYNIDGAGPEARVIIMTNKEDCHCNNIGTIEGSTCDKFTGQCKCKPYVGGRDCDRCKTGYWKLENTENGCISCECDLGGALDGTCDMFTGQCECKPNVIGQTCDSAAQGYFAPNLDFYTYEAEHSDKSEKARIIARTPHPDRKVTWTDSGFMQVFEGSVLEFYVTLTNSLYYDVMIRYESQMPEKWEKVQLLVEQPAPLEPTAFCAAYNNMEVKVTRLSAGRKHAIFSPSICLEAGIKYTLKLNIMNYQNKMNNPKASVLIDSMVLIPVVDNLPIFQDQFGVRKNEFVRNRCRDTQIATIKREITSICQNFINSIAFYIHDQALECGCDDIGSVHNLCSPIGGVCECKPNIIGRRCDHCAPGSYGFGPEGCSLCLCNKIGTDPTSSDCDSLTGQCRCLKNVEGLQCDQCSPNHINLESGKGCTPIADQPESCDQKGYWEDKDGNCNPCDCALGGSFNETCEKLTGKCYCRPNVIGQRCNRPNLGYFVPYLDFVTYEAEYITTGKNVLVITKETPSEANVKWTGIGFLQVFEGSQMEFSVKVPKGLNYYIVIRYEAKLPETWDDVKITIERPSDVIASGPCKNSPSIQNKVASLSPDSHYYVVTPSICLEADITYRIEFQFGRYDRHESTESASIYFDSIVLMPSPHSMPFFQGMGLALIHKKEFIQHGCIETQYGVFRSDVSNVCYKYILGISLYVQEQALACDCDSTGSENADCSSLGGQCGCKRNVIGRTCDSCAPGTYGFGFDGCLLCNCNPQGSDPKFPACDSANGKCHCLSNVIGQQCTTCKENYWNFASGKGCEPCDCSPEGSVSLQCNELEGQCECFPGRGGRQCNECETDKWGDPNVECLDCECNADGSASLQCNKENGSCICLPGIASDKCSECEARWTGTVPYCYPCEECQEEVKKLIDALIASTEKFIEEIPILRQSLTFDEESKIVIKKIDRMRDIIMHSYDATADIWSKLIQVDYVRSNFTAVLEQLNENESEGENVESPDAAVSETMPVLTDLKGQLLQVKVQLKQTEKDIVTVLWENIEDALQHLLDNKKPAQSEPTNSDDNENNEVDDSKSETNLAKYKPIETALNLVKISLKEIEDEMPEVPEQEDVATSETESFIELADPSIAKRLDGYKTKIQKFLKESNKNVSENTKKVQKVLHFLAHIESKQAFIFGRQVRLMSRQISLENIWSAVEADLDKGQKLHDRIAQLRNNAYELFKMVVSKQSTLIKEKTDETSKDTKVLTDNPKNDDESDS